MNYLDLDSQQWKALELMLQGKNVFIMGKAGYGKSRIIRDFITYGQTNTIVLAPTGLAARNINGATIHSVFNFPPHFITEASIYGIPEKTLSKLRTIETIVVDEISMVSSNLFCSMDKAMRIATGNFHSPFGGKSIIVAGDWGQLPPVIQKDLEYLFIQEHGGIHAFETSVWNNCDFTPIELSVNYRQELDRDFQFALDIIRAGHYSINLGEAINYFNQHCLNKNIGEDYTQLCLTNPQVYDINAESIASLNTEPRTYQAQTMGMFNPLNYPTEEQLTLKTGAKVMLLENQKGGLGEAGYVNGDIGIVTALDEGCINVQLARNNLVVSVLPKTWYEYDYEVKDIGSQEQLQQIVIGTFTQIPLRLAYAMTTHKSQGQTLEKVKLCLGSYSCFAHGQLYTALSRVKSVDRLSFDRPMTFNDIIQSKEVFQFYQSIESEYGFGSMLRSGMRFTDSDQYIPARL